jgi:dTDP-4-dehydrorhamnose 3,5-epimerase-like enzyme
VSDLRLALDRAGQKAMGDCESTGRIATRALIGWPPVGVQDCRVIELPIIHDPDGNLTFIEGERHVPFGIKRVYHTYDVPGGAVRGGHAHRTCEEMVIAMSGSFDVVVDDGKEKASFRLNRSWKGLYLPPMIWRDLIDFSSGSVCMVLASDFYEEDDYIRDYDRFRAEGSGR